MTWWGAVGGIAASPHLGSSPQAFREARRCLQNCYVLKYHWEAEQWRRSRLRNWVPELEGIVTWMVEMGQIFLLRLVEIQNDVHKVTKNDILKIYIMKIRLFVYFYFMGLWFMMFQIGRSFH